MISTVTTDGLEMKLVEREMPTPKDHEIVVQVEATPINPSDHGVMFGWADISQASSTGEGTDRCLLYTSPSPRDRTRSRMPSSG